MSCLRTTEVDPFIHFISCLNTCFLSGDDFDRMMVLLFVTAHFFLSQYSGPEENEKGGNNT